MGVVGCSARPVLTANDDGAQVESAFLLDWWSEFGLAADALIVYSTVVCMSVPDFFVYVARQV